MDDGEFLEMEYQGQFSEIISISGIENSFSSIKTPRGVMDLTIQVQIIQHESFNTKQVIIAPR